MYIDRSVYQRYFMLSPKTLAVVTTFLVVSFLSKGIYQIGAIFGNFLLNDIPLQVIYLLIIYAYHNSVDRNFNLYCKY